MNARSYVNPALGVLGIAAVAGLAVWSGPSAANARTDTLKAVVLTQGGDTAGFMRPPRTGAAGRR